MTQEPKHKIGIDIGTSSIKVVGLHKNKRKKKYHFLKTDDFYEKPDCTVLDGLNENNIYKSLKRIFDKVPSRHAALNVCISLPINSVFFLTIPVVPKSELKQVLYWELIPYISGSIENYDFDFRVLSQNNKQKQMKVLVGTIEKEQLQRIQTVFKKLKKPISILDTDLLAVLQLFWQEHQPFSDTTGLLYLGAHHTHYVILSRDHAPYCTQLGFGGNHLNNLISSRMDSSFSQCESLRREQVGPDPVDSLDETNMEIKSNTVDILSSFLQQIEMANAHYSGTTSESVTQLYISGGLANDYNVQTFFLVESDSGFQYHLWNPAQSHFPVDLSDKTPTFHYTAALGMALR